MIAKAQTKRNSRSCLRCRQHKSKCDLDTSGPIASPPCQRCIRAGAECVLGGSNRGGRRFRRVDSQRTVASSRSEGSPAETPHAFAAGLIGRSGSASTHSRDHSHTALASTIIDDTFASSNLHSTTDALNFLSQVATNHSEDQAHQASATDFRSNLEQESHMVVNSPENLYGLLHYQLVSSGSLHASQVAHLLSRYATFYHPYFPIAPRKSLQPAFLHETSRDEPHLLTAMITVAAKDIPDGDETLQACSRYMYELVSEISAGKRRDVQAVEALLLLAEWEPQCSLSNLREIGCGEEDVAAWMHVGLALRLGYYLKLNRVSFKDDNEDRLPHLNRRQLVWAACFLSDRQISVRIGRPFESRGSGPASAYGRHGFPSLQPQNPGEDDHASVFQARLELTSIFSNVHDVLYAGMGSSMKMMLVGNYVKYIDDFRASANAWKSVWGTLTCSPNVKLFLQMSYEYLRLYTNAYAFQAATSRAISADNRDITDSDLHTLGETGSLPDIRFIYESVDAAKSLLTIVNNYIPPEINLCYFPMRFSLYCVNSAVFLYKAWCLGLLTGPEKSGVRQMISHVIEKLRKGVFRPSDLGSRYAQLLETLWQRTDGNTNGIRTKVAPPHQQLSQLQQQPFSNNQDDFFSWLDLQAVGEYLSNDTQIDQSVGIDKPQYTELPRQDNLTWSDMGWLADAESNLFF